MKTWFITLSLLSAAGFVQADDMMYGPAATEAASAPAKMETRARQKAYKHRAGRLPQGDLRHCLGLSSNEEIIACAEGRRKR